jgi:ribonucleoside-diphosphate reductase subunit M1
MLETYNLMFERYFTYASPMLFNAETPHLQIHTCRSTPADAELLLGAYGRC